MRRRRIVVKTLDLGDENADNERMATKTCYTCKQEKDLEEFYKSIGGSQGRASYCKTCSLAQHKIDWKKHRERQAAAGVKFRVVLPSPTDVSEYTCVRCKQVKPIAQFGTQVKKDRTIIKSHCNECASKAATEAWRELRATNPHLAWARQASNQSKIRARERGLPHTMSVDNLVRLAQSGRCVYCDVVVLFQTAVDGPDKFQAASVDRFIPTKGYTVENCVLACYRCNVRKNDASLEDLERLVSAMRRITEERARADTTAADLPQVGDHPTPPGLRKDPSG